MIDRRQFLAGVAAAAAAPRSRGASTGTAGFGPLKADPARILDLPARFGYDIVARRGETMDDGLLVPARADGMGAFAGDDGQVILVCNHENSPGYRGSGPFGESLERLPAVPPGFVYDRGGGRTPGTGGTTTIVWDPRERRKLRQHMSLVGTEVNCAGGPTPWGSWLSCEECFTGPGADTAGIVRERRHGYVFEVPARGQGPVRPEPLTALGRFEHEAAAVDPATGVVYLTEDKHRALFYRFLPSVPGRLAEGGRLQALAIAGRPSFDTRNWDLVRALEPGETLAVTWIDLPEPDLDANELRLDGFERGAARFARGEGLTRAGKEFVMTCTIGGPDRLGQVFAYRPLANGGGELRLIAESAVDSLLRHADNLTASPWGDLVVCEDTAEHCGLVGIRPDGVQYPLADNAYDDSELAGVCFSPAGDELYVNVQDRGLTLAIRGPWTSTRESTAG